MRPIVSYDDIASAPAARYDSRAPPAKKRKTNHRNKRKANREEEELTHDEIWDDSALIDAWDTANEEYAAHHGEDKSWKDECGASEPSILSTNRIRYLPDGDNSKTHADEEPASTPLLNVDFEQASHDPSLGPSVSQDEAFERAASAMYWAGYWTAVYHHKRRLEEEENEKEEEGEEEEEQEEEQVEVEENLVSTQR
ncbi:hypothetical protein EDD18DRAFT_1132788 [Armillaria luteobubalina]|uniref:Survival Motor Neuron Gemin2-binding domain-containing protein n=1 Tax=Armillaria luteobubalina TaxID=153913 RepID=A0AA39QJV7_9AGAR|nr:hypothetical protein EDD18DRAFT_1132788 [Armillaria luteobubalina]